MRKIGRPELKVPGALVDLYYDLRDRRLLPLVALLLVAIVAAPLLLSEGGGGEAAESSSPVTPAPQTASDVSAGASKLTVVKVDPGIRNPRKRLAGRRAKNPFTQQYTGSEAGAASAETSPPPPSSTTTTTTTSGAGGGSSSSNGSAATGHASPPAPSTTTPTESPGGAGHGPTGSAPVKHHNAPPTKAPSPSPAAGKVPAHMTLYAFELEVRISKRSPTAGTDGKAEGGGGAQEPVVKQKVKPATPLPGPKQPVVTYMGTTDGKTALLMISNEVSEVSGEGKCLSGTKDCQLIALAPKEPEILVYGPNRVRYKIEVLQLEPVVTGHT